MSLTENSERRAAALGNRPTTSALPAHRLVQWALDYFEIPQKGSTLRTEVLAGLSTFLALSYIFVVNPAILSQAGMDQGAVLFATITTSAIATLAMGFWGRLPFALAPGMEMNAYVAFFVVGALGFSWQQALGAVFWSGVLFLLLTITTIRQKIIDAVPDRMKAGISLSVGVFLALVALKGAGILRYQGVTLAGVGEFGSLQAFALYISLALVMLLDQFRVRGAVILSILMTTAFCYAIGMSSIDQNPVTAHSAILSGVGKLDMGALLQPKMLSAILILFLIDFYGSIAKLIGLTMNTNVMTNGRLPRMREALLIDSSATIAGSMLGTSSLTVYVESGVGIGAGGRTGLTAIVCGTMMASCFALAPFLHLVPFVASTGALLYVAIKLCPSILEIKSFDRIDLVAMILMQVTVILTFALDRAMLVGFLIYFFRDLITERRVVPYRLVSIILLAVGVLLQL